MCCLRSGCSDPVIADCFINTHIGDSTQTNAGFSIGDDLLAWGQRKSVSGHVDWPAAGPFGPVTVFPPINSPVKQTG